MRKRIKMVKYTFQVFKNPNQQQNKRNKFIK